MGRQMSIMQRRRKARSLQLKSIKLPSLFLSKIMFQWLFVSNYGYLLNLLQKCWSCGCSFYPFGACIDYLISKCMHAKKLYHFIIAGIETDMSKEIIVLDMVTASIILGKWFRPGPRRKWEIFYGGICWTKEWPYLSSHRISLASHANRQCSSSIFGPNSFLCYPCYRVRAAGIRCPVPLLLRLHVLVMEFIGKFCISVCLPDTFLLNNV